LHLEHDHCIWSAELELEPELEEAWSVVAVVAAVAAVGVAVVAAL